jgi:type IV pilus assembly protein PilW
MSRVLFRNKGITLIELLIALVIGSILIAALYQTFIKQQKTYAVQDQVVEAQQNVRVAMDIIVRNVRMAGYNPTGVTPNPFGFTSATANQIIFTGDFNGNGSLDEGETIGFQLSGTNLRRWGVDGWQPLAENIESLSFLYTLSDGTATSAPTAAQLASIRMVKVTIRARTSVEDPELGSGSSAYRRRELISSVKVRNMGL